MNENLFRAFLVSKPHYVNNKVLYAVLRVIFNKDANITKVVYRTVP